MKHRTLLHEVSLDTLQPPISRVSLPQPSHFEFRLTISNLAHFGTTTTLLCLSGQTITLSKTPLLFQNRRKIMSIVVFLLLRCLEIWGRFKVVFVFLVCDRIRERVASWIGVIGEVACILQLNSNNASQPNTQRSLKTTQFNIRTRHHRAAEARYQLFSLCTY